MRYTCTYTIAFDFWDELGQTGLPWEAGWFDDLSVFFLKFSKWPRLRLDPVVLALEAKVLIELGCVLLIRGILIGLLKTSGVLGWSSLHAQFAVVGLDVSVWDAQVSFIRIIFAHALIVIALFSTIGLVIISSRCLWLKHVAYISQVCYIKVIFVSLLFQKLKLELCVLWFFHILELLSRVWLRLTYLYEFWILDARPHVSLWGFDWNCSCLRHGILVYNHFKLLYIGKVTSNSLRKVTSQAYLTAIALICWCNVVLARPRIVVFQRTLNKPWPLLSHKARTTVIACRTFLDFFHHCLLVLIGAWSWIHHRRFLLAETRAQLRMQPLLAKFGKNCRFFMPVDACIFE